MTVRREGQCQAGPLREAEVGRAAVNVNMATQAELEGLPGIGPVIARKIIEGGPDRSVEELERVKGIGMIGDRMRINPDCPQPGARPASKAG